MKLKLDFVSKVPKVAKDNQVILLNNKSTQNKIVKSLNNSIFSNKLFLERKFLIQNINDKSYILVNCIKSKISLDYENLGSQLYTFLKSNKIENSFLSSNSYDLSCAPCKNFSSCKLVILDKFVSKKDFSILLFFKKTNKLDPSFS